MSDLPVIVLDREAGKRQVVPMRWGYPRRGNWRAPDPIHARSETIDTKPTFASAFQNGRRGIVLVKTFNEGKQISPKVTEQHTIMLGMSRQVRSRSFSISLPSPVCRSLCWLASW